MRVSKSPKQILMEMVPRLCLFPFFLLLSMTISMASIWRAGRILSVGSILIGVTERGGECASADALDTELVRDLPLEMALLETVSRDAAL